MRYVTVIYDANFEYDTEFESTEKTKLNSMT